MDPHHENFASPNVLSAVAGGLQDQEYTVTSVICRHGDTQDGHATVTLQPGETIVIISPAGLLDALIVTAAASAGCGILYSKDLHAGHAMLGVRIENPFS